MNTFPVLSMGFLSANPLMKLFGHIIPMLMGGRGEGCPDAGVRQAQGQVPVLLLLILLQAG